MQSRMATWQNYGWLREPLQNWAVKQPASKRDFRRNCIIWSRDEMEAHARSFERARAEYRGQPRPHPTPRHRRLQDFAPPPREVPWPPVETPRAPVASAPRGRPITQDWVAPHAARHGAPHHGAPHHHAAQHQARPADPHRADPRHALHRYPVPHPAHAASPQAHLRAGSLLDPAGLADVSMRDLSVGILIVALPPLGVMLLWMGPRDRDTKVVTTVVAMMWMTALTVITLAGIVT